MKDTFKFKSFKKTVLGPLVALTSKGGDSEEVIAKKAFYIIQLTVPFVEKYKQIPPNVKKNILKQPSNFESLFQKASTLENLYEIDSLVSSPLLSRPLRL